MRYIVGAIIALWICNMIFDPIIIRSDDDE